MRLGARSYFLLSSFVIELFMHWGKPTTLISFAVAVGVLYLGILGAMDTLADVLRWANPFGVADFGEEDEQVRPHEDTVARGRRTRWADLLLWANPFRTSETARIATRKEEGSGDCEEARELKKKGLEAGLDFILLESKEPPFDILPTYEEGYISCDSEESLREALKRVKENGLTVGRFRLGNYRGAEVGGRQHTN